MYFDAILNDEMETVFNGTTEEVVAHIKKNPKVRGRIGSDYRVCIGSTMQIIDIPLYLDQFDI